eukprot:859806-Pyramimonas_sp.AAC.1
MCHSQQDSALRVVISVGGIPPTGGNLATSAHRAGGQNAFGARVLPATGIDVGLLAGAAPPRRMARDSD